MISVISAMLLAGMEQPPPVPPPPPPAVRAYPSPPVPPTSPTRPAKRARPLAEPASLVTNRDYPRAALRANVQGSVVYTLDVDPDGRVAGCRVTRPSGSAELDAATCQIMQSRARFEPARDAQGKPVADRYTSRIAWRINRRLNQPFEPLMMVEVMRADAAGALTCFSGTNGARALPKPGPAGPNATGLASLAKGQRKPLALSVVIKLTPDGAAEPADPIGRGDLFRATDAVLTIGADGVVDECRVTRSEWIGGGNIGVPPSPCLDWYPGMMLYRKAAKGAPPRTVKVTVRGYAAH